MGEFLFQYQPVQPTTWVYLSSLVTIGLFFKFGRFWSIRNLDLLMLILVSPGLLMLYFGYQIQVIPSQESMIASERTAPVELSGDFGLSGQPNTVDATEGNVSELAATAHTKRWGYMWLLGCCALWSIRMGLDPVLVRRPLLSPNLTVGGLAFMGVALLIFLMANVITQEPVDDAKPLGSGVRMDQLMRLKANHGPGYAILKEMPLEVHKTVVIASHIAIILGLVLIGSHHFGNAGNGFGAAMLYLLLPYTSQLTGRVDHFLPSALLVWAILCYRKPVLSGIFIGLASGSTYYPLFLLPLWISFYWQKGSWRFVLGVALALICMAGSLLLLPSDAGVLTDLRRMFGIMQPVTKGLEGVWDLSIGGWDPIYRMPVLVACVGLCFSLILWPARKNLGTLISCSGLVMLSSQFWIGWSGGLYIAWFLPLILLTIFRPNLDDRVAQSVLSDGWFSKRRAPLSVAA